MILLKAEAIEEENALFNQLDVEDAQLKKQMEADEKRRGAIKEQVGTMLDFLGGKGVRVVVGLESGRTWDRRVSTRGGGLSVALLEEAMGTAAYQKLLCVKTTSYVLIPEKLEEARKSGKVTDDMIKAATVPGKPQNSMYHTKLEDIKDEDGD